MKFQFLIRRVTSIALITGKRTRVLPDGFGNCQALSDLELRPLGPTCTMNLLLVFLHTTLTHLFATNVTHFAGIFLTKVPKHIYKNRLLFYDQMFEPAPFSQWDTSVCVHWPWSILSLLVGEHRNRIMDKVNLYMFRLFYVLTTVPFWRMKVHRAHTCSAHRTIRASFARLPCRKSLHTVDKRDKVARLSEILWEVFTI